MEREKYGIAASEFGLEMGALGMSNIFGTTTPSRGLAVLEAAADRTNSGAMGLPFGGAIAFAFVALFWRASVDP